MSKIVQHQCPGTVFKTQEVALSDRSNCRLRALNGSGVYKNIGKWGANDGLSIADLVVSASSTGASPEINRVPKKNEVKAGNGVNLMYLTGNIQNKEKTNKTRQKKIASNYTT